jgi:hypothetical protein
MPAIDDEVATELQRLRLAAGTQVQIRDGFEIGIVGKAEDTAVDLDSGKAQHICPDVVQDMIEGLFGTQRIAAIFEQGALVEDAVAFATPKWENSSQKVVQISTTTASR